MEETDREGERGREVEAHMEDPGAEKSSLVTSRGSRRTGLGLLKSFPPFIPPVIRGILITASSFLRS